MFGTTVPGKDGGNGYGYSQAMGKMRMSGSADAMVRVRCNIRGSPILPVAARVCTFPYTT